jgi:putative flippase GtrA
MTLPRRALAGAVPREGGSLRRQLPRYVAAGVLSALTDFGSYSLLVHGCGWNLVLANGLSRPLGGMTCFLLNRHWTFAEQRGASARRQLLRFWCVFGISYALSWLLLEISGNRMGWHPMLAKTSVEGVVLIFNFLCLKHWTFR